MVKIKIRGDYLLESEFSLTTGQQLSRMLFVDMPHHLHTPGPFQNQQCAEDLEGFQVSHQDDLEVQKLPVMLVSKQFRFLFLKTKDWI